MSNTTWNASPPCPFPLPVQEQVLLSTLCTLRLGGPARYYAMVTRVDELMTFLRFCITHRVRYFLLGKGSNCLFDDQGFNGLVVHNAIRFLHFLPEGVIHVGAGYSFSHLGTVTAREGFRGLEFAAGIPGSVGGAVFMNAGANKSETADCLESVDYLLPNGTLCTFSRDQLHFAYRHSPFQSMNGAILSARFRCQLDTTALERQRLLLADRKRKQPLQQPSAGCVFANPPSASAGALIDQAGLKGMSIGGVSVSTLHANFLIHTGGGTSAAMQTLIAHIQEKVALETGIDLKREVRYIAFEEDPPSCDLSPDSLLSSCPT